MSSIGLSDILSFVTPDAADGLQQTFFWIFAAALFLTIFSAHFFSGPKAWEKMWRRAEGSTEGGLDLEHGSVFDLSNAIATRSEIIKDFMPGILLVFGLLGTFLGLGIALERAAAALQSAGSGVDAMSGDMMSMLQGLGMKFKTSTWGIICFILLKIWDQYSRFDEKRLIWVVSKVKEELVAQENQAEQEKLNKRTELYNKMMGSATFIAKSASTSADAALAYAREREARFEKQLESAVQSLQNGLGQLDASLQNAFQRLNQSIDTGNQLATAAAATALAYEQEREARTETRLESSVQALQQGMSQLDSSIKAAFDALNHNIHSGNGRVEAAVTALGSSIDASSSAMVDFADNTQKIIQQMADAADGMSNGANKVSTAAEGLGSVVNAFGDEFKEVLNDVRVDLGSAITNMSEKAATTLEASSEKLESATSKISAALEELSDDIKETLSEVKQSIEKAQAIQVRTATSFAETTETLNRNIEVTTQNAEILSNRIEEGLESVSDVGMNMHTVAKALQSRITKEEAQSKEYAERLETIASLIKSINEHIESGNITLNIETALEGNALVDHTGAPTQTKPRLKGTLKPASQGEGTARTIYIKE